MEASYYTYYIILIYTTQQDFFLSLSINTVAILLIILNSAYS